MVIIGDTPLLSGERALVVGRTRTCCLAAMLEASGIQECIMEKTLHAQRGGEVKTARRAFIWLFL